MAMFEYKENMKRVHNIPLGQLVEIRVEEDSSIDGMRLYVTEHRRDCDGTPLYALGMRNGDSWLFNYPEESISAISR